MARNEVVVHIEDKQISELKKSINQSDLKKIREIEKLSKQLVDINKRLNMIISWFESLYNTLEEKEESDG